MSTSDPSIMNAVTLFQVRRAQAGVAPAPQSHLPTPPTTPPTIPFTFPFITLRRAQDHVRTIESLLKDIASVPLLNDVDFSLHLRKTERVLKDMVGTTKRLHVITVAHLDVSAACHRRAEPVPNTEAHFDFKLWDKYTRYLTGSLKVLKKICIAYDRLNNAGRNQLKNLKRALELGKVDFGRHIASMARDSGRSKRTLDTLTKIFEALVTTLKDFNVPSLTNVEEEAKERSYPGHESWEYWVNYTEAEDGKTVLRGPSSRLRWRR